MAYRLIDDVSNHRVLNYEATVVYEDGSTHTKTYPFTDAQVYEIGSVLEPDGISLNSAWRLIDRWNQRGRGRYRYDIPLCGHHHALAPVEAQA